MGAILVNIGASFGQKTINVCSITTIYTRRSFYTQDFRHFLPINGEQISSERVGCGALRVKTRVPDLCDLYPMQCFTKWFYTGQA